MRSLPDFFIIGAQKAGTTSLYRYLSRHSCVLPALTKEVRFFSSERNFRRGLNWYRAHFPTAVEKWRRRRVTGAAVLTGEATPCLYHAHVPPRVHRALPDLKLIALLRDPIARAWSHYQHQRSRGREPLSFEEVVEAELRLHNDGLAALLSEGLCSWRTAYRQPYVWRGVYADHLARWRKYYPEDRILILGSELMLADPARTYDRVVRFLGLPEAPPPPFKRHNVTRRRPEMDAALKTRLGEFYRLHNRRLYELVGEDFAWDA